MHALLADGAASPACIIVIVLFLTRFRWCCSTKNSLLFGGDFLRFKLCPISKYTRLAYYFLIFMLYRMHLITYPHKKLTIHLLVANCCTKILLSLMSANSRSFFWGNITQCFIKPENEISGFLAMILTAC